MKRLVLAGAVVAALAFSGCQDGFAPVDSAPPGVKQFYIYDKGGDSFDYGMAVRACDSIGEDLGNVQELPHASGIATCRPPVNP